MTEYFSHDANARNDSKILELRSEFGWEGYGIYFGLIETLREQSNYTYPSNALAGLKLGLNIEEALLQQILSKCFDVKLLIEKDGVFYSESLMNRMEKIDSSHHKRAAAGRKGGIASAKVKRGSSNA